VLTLLLAGAIATLFSLVLTPVVVRLFQRLQLGQLVRVDGPQTHLVKRGTPTMGGVVFILAAVVGVFGSALLTGAIVPVSVLLVLMMTIGMALIGFIDDFLKVRRQNSLGLFRWGKIIGQIIVGSVFALLALISVDRHGIPAATQFISLDRDVEWASLAVWGGIPVIGLLLYLVWINFLAIATTNGVNLTDGLDGLAGGASVLAISAYVLIGFWQSQQDYCGSPSKSIPAACYSVQDPLALATVASALCGGLIGFLWWNTHPAKIIMGDTGALGIGGAITALAVLTRTELLLVLIGGLFVVEVGSVILQRGYFKITHGKRIFRFTPIHHHFEFKGWSEVTIVVRFWILAGLCTTLGLGPFYALWLTS
jgi:phospho-N-acetylmuramoyl-pentapeptide-transferase